MQCPKCEAEVEPGTAACSGCGAVLERPSGRSWAWLVRLGVILTLGLLGGGGLLLLIVVPARLEGMRKADRVGCANNLRQLGAAALQYADDRRFFPHYRTFKIHDGDVTSSDTPRKMRALLWFGYLDTPEAFVCPASGDKAYPVEDPAVRANLRRWFWAGSSEGNPQLSPFLDSAPDPRLDETRELSYGWRRRLSNANVRSNAQLGADRALLEEELPADDPLRGNHRDGWNLVYADVSVRFIEPTEAPEIMDYLIGTDHSGQGNLSLKDQTHLTRRRLE